MRSKRTTITAPKLCNSEIIRIAEQLTIRYARLIEPELGLLYTGFDAIYREIIYPEFEIEIVEGEDLGFDENGEKILGSYDVQSNTAFIDLILSGNSTDPRRAFTLWHEVGGHGLLQGDFLRSQLSSSSERLITTETSITNQTMNILERQANLFAASAGVPRWLLAHSIQRVFRPTRPFRFIGPSHYCLEVLGQCRHNLFVETFDELCQLIAFYIKPSFGGMSAECIGYQIAKTNFVVDETAGPPFLLRRSQKQPNYSVKARKSAEFASNVLMVRQVG